MKKILNLVLLLTLAVASHAQRVLTLDSCRALALANNKELRMSQEKIKAAHYEQKAAFTNFLPKIDVWERRWVASYNNWEGNCNR